MKWRTSPFNKTVEVRTENFPSFSRTEFYIFSKCHLEFQFKKKGKYTQKCCCNRLILHTISICTLKYANLKIDCRRKFQTIKMCENKTNNILLTRLVNIHLGLFAKSFGILTFLIAKGRRIAALTTRPFSILACEHSKLSHLIYIKYCKIIELYK